MTKVKEIKKLYGSECVDVEVYKPLFSDDDTNAYAFRTDYVKFVDDYPETAEVITFQVMDEEDYNTSICANTSSADFDEWYDDKNAKVLCILIKSSLN